MSKLTLLPEGVVVRQYYLHTRNRVFYVQFTDPVTHKRLSALSTGKTLRDDALMVLAEWMKNGVPARKSEQKHDSIPSRTVDDLITMNQVFSAFKHLDLTSDDIGKIETILKDRNLVECIIKKRSAEAETVEDFLKRFWTYDKSPYVAEKKTHGKSIGTSYTDICLERVAIYWIPYFKGKMIGEVTRQDIKEFSVAIDKNHSALSPNTLRLIMLAGTIAFRWAFNNELIPSNPTLGIGGYTRTTKKRGVLTPDEACRLFKFTWKDGRIKLINEIAMTTGLRVGEILALRKEHIGGKYLSIHQSYSAKDGIKKTKTEESRIVPVVKSIQDKLRQYADSNPYGNGLIFYDSVHEDRPLGANLVLDTFKRMLVNLYREKNPEATVKEAEAYWKSRNIVFHSWRHFYAARMTDKIAARKVMLATGHKTEAVFKGYSDHALESDLEEVAATTEEVFTGLIS
jgi:integrase